MEIRDALAGDLPAILAIYNQVIATSTAVYRDDPVDLANRRTWFDERRARGQPVLVASDATSGLPGGILGFASFGPFRDWPGYRHTVEHMVHVHAETRGRGVGRALIEALLARAQAMGLHVMIAGIDADNAGSIALHEKLGFEQSGHMREVGVKFGRWLDLVFMQKRLGNGPGIRPK
jgi:L-amino acid N-acyltransferase YncA